MKPTDCLWILILFPLLLLACGGEESEEPGARSAAPPGSGEGLPDPEDEQEEPNEDDPVPTVEEQDALSRALDTLMIPGPVPGSVGIQIPEIGSSPGVLDPTLSGRYKITDELLDEYGRVAAEMQAAASAGKNMQAVLNRHGWHVMKYSYVTSRIQQAAMLAASGSTEGADPTVEVKARIAELEERVLEHPDEKARIGLELNMLRMKLVALQQVGGVGPAVSPESREETKRIRRWLTRVRRTAPR